MNSADVKADLWRVLGICTRAEVIHILDNVRAGKIDGGDYLPIREGECGCLIGAICEMRGFTFQTYMEWGAVHDLDINRYLETVLGIKVGFFQPIESFLFFVDMGNTPSTSETLAQLESWLLEWLGTK